MNRFTLTEEEKASLELQHLPCKDKKDSDRLKAVLLRSEEWTVPKVSQALRVHQTTTIRHINEYHGVSRAASFRSLFAAPSLEPIVPN